MTVAQLATFHHDDEKEAKSLIQNLTSHLHEYRRDGGIRTHDLFVPTSESNKVRCSILTVSAGQSFGL